MSSWSPRSRPGRRQEAPAGDPVVRVPAPRLAVSGMIPGLDEVEFAHLRSELLHTVDRLMQDKALGPFDLSIHHRRNDRAAVNVEPSPATSTPAVPHPKAGDLHALEPLWQFEQLVLPPDVMETLQDCVAYAEVAPTVFTTWNLRSIEPHPSIAINFRGPPGTGKTMAAHALAARMGRKILLSRLSDLESKYHGDGPKNVVHLFEAATAQEAVLFIDEAESLLSRRFAQPNQAAESSINSMRTELLMALDAFEGLVIFASNLHDSYDAAISSRLTHVDFPLPDAAARREIWRRHLPPELPLDPDVNLDELASIEGVTGRDVRRAVIAAAVSAARQSAPSVTHMLLKTQLRRQVGTVAAALTATTALTGTDGVDRTVVRDLVQARLNNHRAPGPPK